MPQPRFGLFSRLQKQLLPILIGPPILAFLPALTLGAFWMGGEFALIMTSLGLPLVFAFGGVFEYWRRNQAGTHDSVTGLMLRPGFEEVVAQTFEVTSSGSLRSACFMLEIDDLRDIADRHGQSAADKVIVQTGDRILSALRDGDAVARIGDNRFAICLSTVRQLDLELCIQLAGRLQSAIEEPISLDGLSLYQSCSVGFCLRNRAPGKSSESWLEATSAALSEAQKHGPSGIRAFSAEIHRQTKTRSDLREEAGPALENGQIQPWFQPQISTDTGKVTGFEVLARWSHPIHGMIPPDVFLPAIEEAGLLERLSQVMMYHAMTALRAWDNAGLNVPRVGVNFATDELRNPGLVEKIRWELDRFELNPDRIAIEILETVMTDNPEDIVTHNIIGLSKLGCRIDLDDFGTGHASIASIRRFKISRIKIDRSFVMKADRDPEQQRLIGAVLTMAERLDLETLAEGVETVGEHALLAQLGCDHVQGFGIGRPMPFDQTIDWITAHQAKLQDAPKIGKKST